MEEETDGATEETDISEEEKPEEPDASMITEETEYYIKIIYNGDKYFRIPANPYDIQMSKNGVFAIQYEYNGAVYIYKNGKKTHIPAPVSYFQLSDNGEKIVYGSTTDEAWIWDIKDEEAEQVLDSMIPGSISSDGSTLIFNNGTLKPGGELQLLPDSASCMCVSEDGGIVYYYARYGITEIEYDPYSGEEMEKRTNYFMDFGCMVDGESRTLLSYVDPNRYPEIVAVSEDFQEVIVRFVDDYYYCSLNDEKNPARRISGINNGQIVSLASLSGGKTCQESQYYYNNSIEDWRANGYFYNRYGDNRQGSILGSAFAVLISSNDVHSVAIAVLDEELNMKTIATNITDNICVSDDGTRIWCVSDELLTYCDLTDEQPVVKQSVYVGIHSHYGHFLAASADGMNAACTTSDGSLYLCSADSIDDAFRVSDKSIGVWCGPDDNFYALRNPDFSIYNYDKYSGNCILYLIDTESRQLLYQKERVEDLCVTKNGFYILVSGYDDMYYVYCKDGELYRFVSDTDLYMLNAARYSEY